MEPHKYIKQSWTKKCSACSGNKDATQHLQWLDQQDALAHQEARKKGEEYFDYTADFEIGTSLYFSCKKCFAVVYAENLGPHVEWHEGGL